jgi:endonuclease V-like protein UPF0215 family
MRRIGHVKKEIRLMGISVSGRAHEDRFSIVGVVLRGGLWLDGIVWSQFRRNQKDILEKTAEMILKSKFFKELRVVILCSELVRRFRSQGLLRFVEILGLPIIAVVDDRTSRFDQVLRCKSILVKVRKGRFLSLCMGLTQDEAEAILRISWEAGRVPEPLRIAHLVASALDATKS